MGKNIFTVLTITIFIWISVIPVTAIAQDSEEKIAKESCQYKILSNIDKVTNINVPDGVPVEVVKLFETSAGDPAMNGNLLLLLISQDLRAGETFAWETGIDMLDIESINVDQNHAIVIKGKESVMNSEGSIGTRPVTYKVVLSFANGMLSNRINISKTN